MADVLLPPAPEATIPIPEITLEQLGHVSEVEKLESMRLPVPPFDPAIHLNYCPPSARHSFTELGLPIPKGCPDICYTEPFQLFSEEGVRMIRREVFQREFLDKYIRSWERTPCYISGHHHVKDVSDYLLSLAIQVADSCLIKDAPFLKQAWYHPVTQAAVNFSFGCALQLQGGEVAMGVVNVQLGPDGIPGVYNIPEVPVTPLASTDAPPQEVTEENMVDKWHKDMTPVVLVLMLSDTSTMVGGETAIKVGNGNIVKARGANVGGAVMMAGGYLEHAAMRAHNCAERLSLVNSYTYMNPDADDSATTLKSMNVTSDNLPNAKNIIMAQKLARLRGRCDLALQKVEQRRERGEAPSREEVEDWVKDQIYMLKHTAWEMFERMPNYIGKEIPEGTLQKYLSDV